VARVTERVLSVAADDGNVKALGRHHDAVTCDQMLRFGQGA